MKKFIIETLSALIEMLEDLKTKMIDEIIDTNETIKEDFVFLNECSSFGYSDKCVIKLTRCQYRLMKNRRGMLNWCCRADKRIAKYNRWIQKLEG